MELSEIYSSGVDVVYSISDDRHSLKRDKRMKKKKKHQQQKKKQLSHCVLMETIQSVEPSSKN